MPRSRLVVAAFLLSISLSTVLSAQNLIVDGGFAVGAALGDWNKPNGSWQVGPDSKSCGLSGAADGTSALITTDHFLALYSSHCIEVDPVATPTLLLAASYKTSYNVFARLYLTFFSDSSCGSHIGYSSFVAGTISPAWKRIAGSITLPETTASVRVNLDFNPAVAALGQYTGSYDDVYLGAAPELFVDGFDDEGGGTCHWSSVVGGT